MSAKKLIEDIYPLSPLQEGIYYHVCAEPESPIYWNQLTARITGAVDAELFYRAWQSALDNYPVLRTSILVSKRGRALQVVAKQVALPWVYEDWSGLSKKDQDLKLDKFLTRDRANPPDLRRPPLTRVALFKLAASEYTLVWCQHHIILDGWSGPLVLESVFHAYSRLVSGEEPALQKTGSFAAYLKWLGQKDKTAAEEFWQGYFGGFRQNGDAVNTAILPSRFLHVEKNFSETQTLQLEKFARACRVTLNTLVQCAWSLTMAAETGESKITTGVTIADRPAELEDAEKTVGLLLATLPVNLDINSSSKIDDWLRHSQDQFSEVCQHAASLADIHTWSGRASTKPLFDNLIVFENFPFAKNLAQSAGLRLDDFVSIEFTNYRLTLVVAPMTELHLKLTCLESAIAPARAQRIIQRLQFLLDALCAAPDTLLPEFPLLMAEEYERVIAWNDNARVMPYTDVLTMFNETVRRMPDKVAVCFEDVSLSYAELARVSTALAGALIEKGVAQDQLVAIGLPRSEMLPVALLGVLKAGAAYIPLDLDYPDTRLDDILDDSNCDILISTSGSRVLPGFSGCRINIDDLDLFNDFGSPGPELAERRPGSIAYLIYTSGSTGKPKGVRIGHGQLVNLLSSVVLEPGLGCDDRWLAVTTLSFDISILELFGPLMVGATVHIAGGDEITDGHWLVKLFDQVKPTIMQATPATWSLMLAADWQGSESFRVLCGGEALDRHLANQLLERADSLWNMYGPTETTVWSACHEIESGDDPILIGHAIANTQTLILDKNQQVVPVGVSGELYIGGDGVADGYWQREELNAERFVTLPHLAKRHLTKENERWFKTGDVARWHPNGDIELFGRKDNQIKLRGFRIEPEEIETALSEHPGIEACCVVLKAAQNQQNQQQNQDSHLVAYYVKGGSAEISILELRRHLSRRVPRYMIPQQFTLLDLLPLTPNAKLDRKLLMSGNLEQYGVKSSQHRHIRLPSTPSEKYYSEIWQELLNVKEISVSDTFFDIGGYSLLSMHFVTKVKNGKGIDIPLLSVLLNTLGQLALQYPIGDYQEKEL